jgi:hypothetical protein
MLSMSPLLGKVERFFAGCQVKQSRGCAAVEVELKPFLRWMPFGVFTYPQLRQEMRRCVDLGTPFPFVLAVIPCSAHRRTPLRAPSSAKTFSSRPGRLLDGFAFFSVALSRGRTGVTPS